MFLPIALIVVSLIGLVVIAVVLVKDYIAARKQKADDND